MTLQLDPRQRAMLLEMGVRVWLPGAQFAVADAQAPERAQAPQRLPAQPAIQRAPVPAVQRPVPTLPAVHSADANAAPLEQVAALATLDWSGLSAAAASCQACKLCRGRQNSTLCAPQAAPGAQPLAHWMVVGDAPDEEEDAAGGAFAGQSGVLLDNMLKALGLRRINPLPSAPAVENVPAPHVASTLAPQHSAYVTSVLKCRPPHGTLPQAADLAQCSAFLQREIALVQPRMILGMGRFANQLLLAETPALALQPLGKLRGSVRHYQGVAVVLTYHPKALLRNSADKAKAWADLCLAADMLDAAGS